MDTKKLLEMEKTLPPLSYDDLLTIMYVFGRQHKKDYANMLVAGAVHLISEAQRYSYEKSKS